MALSPAFIDEHIDRWQRHLTSHFQPHRAKWPSRLFHHSPLDNMIQILRSGVLRSRCDPLNDRIADVAGEGVIDARIEAHDYVRFYFRPNTPTQYHIEGIKKPADCMAFGARAHAPILVMLLLKARDVLSQKDILFSNGNMQSDVVQTGNSEAFFQALPFHHVFHEGSTGGVRDIIFHRCAEVLTPSPLPLDENLEAICFRSIPERNTLIHLMGADADRWRSRMWVSEDLRLFQRRFPFVREITLTRSGLVFSINPRHDLAPLDLKVQIRDDRNLVILDRWYSDLPSVPPQGDRWHIAHEFADGNYLVELAIEDKLAFKSTLTVGDIIF